jgi:hypothetical protein
VFLFKIFTEYYKQEKAGSVSRCQPSPDIPAGSAGACQLDCPVGIKAWIT